MSWFSVAWNWYSAEVVSTTRTITHPHADLINPAIGFLAALTLAWAALKQAVTAGKRHSEQTNADRQRRITESFSKAIEQLGSDKPEVRLGGIYALERISKESSEDYWTVMESLTAFVRERSRRNNATGGSEHSAERIATRAHLRSIDAGPPGSLTDEFLADATKQERQHTPPMDIATVLQVIRRRSELNYKRERRNGWQLDFNGAALHGADFRWAHLESAMFMGAVLTRATFFEAHLKGCFFHGAGLEQAAFRRANLEGALFNSADLRGALFDQANLKQAYLRWANLGEADLRLAVLDGAYLEGADLSLAHGLTNAQIATTSGDVDTKLPDGLTRPAQWADDKFRLLPRS
jgi:uncharacterized protein YjbI with pentapeptide repeats